MNKSFFIYAFLSLSVLSCGKQADVATNTSTLPAPTPNPGAPTAPGSGPTVTVTDPLALQVYTVYDKTHAIEYQKFTETGTSTCTSTTTTPNVTCSVPIPEGRIYFSSLNFQFSWNTGSCKLLTFQPYYYQASNTANFSPPWVTSPIDCSASPILGTCFGGAAVGIVPSFPKFRALIYTPDESLPPGPQTHTETVSSANAGSVGSNRQTVNDLALGKRATAYPAGTAFIGTDAYLANTFVDYTFACADDYSDPLPYRIHVNITDINSSPTNPVINNFNTWAEAP